MEIMGLALIVILIGLGLLFAVQYTVKKPAQTTQITKDKTIAVNFITAMLNTNTECNQKLIKELLQDCALSRQIKCKDKETNPCDYAKLQITPLLDRTIKQWNKKYDLLIMPEDQPDSPIAMKFSTTTNQNACSKATEVTSSGPFLLTAVSGYNLVLKLDVC